MISFYDRSSDYWHAVVYHADCTLASAAGAQIHLHARAWGSYMALDALLTKILGLIGECFSFPGGEEVPILLECGAKCSCAQGMSLVAVAGEGGKVAEVQDVVPADRVDQPGEKGTADITDISRSPGFQAGSEKHITPVVQEIEGTPEVIEQPMHSCPAESSPAPSAVGGNSIDSGEGYPGTTAHSPATVVPPINILTPTAQSSNLPVAPQSNTDPAEPDAEVPIPASFRGEDSTQGTATTEIRNEDDHTRVLIREEIGRVLDMASGSLSPMGLYLRDVIREEIELMLNAALGSIPRRGA